MTTIVPISELRDTSKMQELCEIEPVFITKNGYGCMVLLDINQYNELQEARLNKELQRECEKSYAEGGDVDAREFLKTLHRYK